MRLPPVVAAILAALTSTSARADDGEGPGRTQFLSAVHRSGPVELDGRLDEAAWGDAPAFDAFVQVFPDEGAAPTEHTSVRVLYDDTTLYVGVDCADRTPQAIVQPLGRRDSPPPSDYVQVVIDSNHDHRTAMSFLLTAGGVQQDGLFFDDDRFTPDWDEVWDGRTQVDAHGWSAEFALPLAMFHFAPGARQTWGFGVKRELGRTHEAAVSVLLPRSARGVVSRLGHLVGLDGVRARANVQLAPYLAARTSLRPQYSYDARPQPRLLDPSADLGLDLRANLGPSLVLNAAVNPDFGQVEADQILVNLTTFEIFRPEKRPFFNQGLDLFQPVGAGQTQDPVPQQLFYSRRIGLDTPILAAAKLTGHATDTVQVGLLDAFVTGAELPAGSSESRPDRTPGLHVAQPLHLALGDSLPLADPLTQNYFAGVARWEPAGSTTFGATVTSAVPFGPRCTDEEYNGRDTDPSSTNPDGPFVPRRCLVRSGNAAALDWNVRTRDSQWGTYGQVAVSQWLGGPPELVLADGTPMHEGDTGWGAYVTAGRLGGEPWRSELRWEYESPRLELNASGYQRTQNEQAGQAQVQYVRPTGGGPFHNYSAVLWMRTQWTTDGRALNRGNSAWLSASGLLREPYLNLGCDLGYQDPRNDVRELGTGVPLVRPAVTGGDCWAETNPSSRVAASAWFWLGRSLEMAPLRALWSGAGGATLVLRPHPRLETTLLVVHERNAWPVKYMDDRPDDGPGAGPHQYLLAQLSEPTLSVTLKQLVVLAPRLTLQLWAQLFSACQEDGPYWHAASDGAAITPGALVPVQPAFDRTGQSYAWLASYDVHETQLYLNVVLRWEYRPGSLLYLVYTRAQHEALPESGVVYDGPLGLSPHGLADGPATDTVLLKWSYWWNP